MDYYLKFENEAAMRAAFGSVTTDGPFGPHTAHPLVEGLALDIVGEIHQPTGDFEIVDGLEVPVFADLTGWHVNLRGEELPEDLVPFRIYPQNPRRVWA